MVLKVNQAVTTKVQVLDEDKNPALAAVVTYTLYDETDAVFASGNMAHIGKGIYTASWTPDTAGEWTFECECVNPKFYDAFTYFVAKGEEDVIPAVKAKTDLIPADPTAKSGAKGLDDVHDDVVDVHGHVSPLPADPSGRSQHSLVIDVWGVAQVLVTITSASQTLSLPDVVLPASLLPTGYTLTRVVALFSISLVRDTSQLDNSINNASTAIQVRKAAGAWTNAITIPNGSWATKHLISDDRAGDGIVGTIDVKTTVNADNSTYNFQIINAQAIGNNLLLLDVKVGLRLYFY